MTNANNIKELRKSKNMTQKELAQKTGLSEVTIRKYESGDRNPSEENLLKIYMALGESINGFKDKYRVLSNLFAGCGALVDDVETSQEIQLTEYIKTLGYEILSDESEGYLVIKSPSGEYEISQSQLDDIFNSTKSFVQFKINDIITNSRKIGK